MTILHWPVETATRHRDTRRPRQHVTEPPPYPRAPPQAKEDDPDDLSSIFCSKLIAVVYKRAGLIAPGRASSDFLPKHFSQVRRGPPRLPRWSRRPTAVTTVTTVSLASVTTPATLVALVTARVDDEVPTTSLSSRTSYRRTCRRRMTGTSTFRRARCWGRSFRSRSIRCRRTSRSCARCSRSARARSRRCRAVER